MTDPAFCKHDPVTSWNAAAAACSGWQHRRAGFNSKANQNLGQRLQTAQSSTVRARAGVPAPLIGPIVAEPETRHHVLSASNRLGR
jgi:hypothetical protein